MAYSIRWEQYRAEVVRKFGCGMPNLETTCKDCGQVYGEHYGADCPITTKESNA